MEESSNVDLCYLQPDLLQKDTIINMLIEREIKIDNLENLSKKDLLNIYKSFILPLPQRQSKSDAQTDSNKPSTKHSRNLDEINNSTKKIKLSENRFTNVLKADTETRKRAMNDSLEDGDASNSKKRRQVIKWP